MLPLNHHWRLALAFLSKFLSFLVDVVPGVTCTPGSRHQDCSLWYSFCCSVPWICFLQQHPCSLYHYCQHWQPFCLIITSKMQKNQPKEHLPCLYLLHIFRRHKFWSPADLSLSFKSSVCLDHFLRRKKSRKKKSWVSLQDEVIN